MRIRYHEAGPEHGFVLVTSLIMLSLLTLLSMAMYFSGRIATQSSRSVQTATEAYYYAETAVNYMAWALANDAEFDNHAYSGTYVHGVFGEPRTPANAVSVGDSIELRNYLWNPGPTLMGSDLSDGITGQVMYFDNSPMNARSICFEGANVFANCTDVTRSPGERKQPTLFQISAKLPRYIKLDIASDGTISSSIPKLPHHNPPVVGEDIPLNGAVVWLTAGDYYNASRDMELFPLDPVGDYAGTLKPSACDPSVNSCPCSAAGGWAYTGDVGSDNVLEWKPASLAGLAVDIALTKGAPGSALTLAVVGNAITVSLAADASGNIVSTAVDVMNAVNADANANALVSVAIAPVVSPKFPLVSPPANSGLGVVKGEEKKLVWYKNLSAQACDANTGEWVPGYNRVLYAVGYVNGRPSHMLRSVAQ